MHKVEALTLSQNGPYAELVNICRAHGSEVGRHTSQRVCESGGDE